MRKIVIGFGVVAILGSFVDYKVIAATALPTVNTIFKNSSTLSKLGTGPTGLTYKGEPVQGAPGPPGPSYTLPPATASVLGGIKVGSGLAITGDGILSNTGVAGVSSFNGRGGAITPGFNDYSASMIKRLSTVGKTGSYADLLNKPTIPAAQVNSDWSASSGVAQILNKPVIPAAQVNSDWNSLSGVSQILNKPTVPTALSQLTEDSTHRTVTDVEKNTWNTNTVSVNSVNGKTGTVTLNATEVGADALGSATSVITNHESTYNHLNLPTTAEKGAMIGTSGTPGVGNPFVTDLSFKNYTGDYKLTKSEAASTYKTQAAFNNFSTQQADQDAAQDSAISAAAGVAGSALQPGGEKRAMTYIIAPAAPWKADYYCSSYSNDCGAAVQAAVDSIAGSAKIEFTPGYFPWSTGLVNTKNNIVFVSPGEGAYHHVLRPITAITVSTGTSSRIYANRFYGFNWQMATATSPTLSGNGSTVTVTTGAAHGFTTGDSIWLRGWNGGTGTFNGIYTITVADSTHFTYSATGNGAPTGGKVGYAATAIKSVKSSQQYTVDCKYSDFSTSIYAEEAWDHYEVNPQIFDSGSGSTYLTGGRVIYNGSADKTAGYQVVGGRTESWLSGMGSPVVLDGSGASGLFNDTISFIGHKFENYISSPVIKANKTTKVRIVGGNFMGVTSNIIDCGAECISWTVTGNEINESDASGRSQPIQTAIKYAGTGLLFTGNNVTGSATNPAIVQLTSTAGQSRLVGNLINYTARNTPWLLNESADGSIVEYGNSYHENITEALLNLSDNTTANASTTKHGFAPKLPNDATKYLDGSGAWTVPAGGGGAGTLTSVGLALPVEFTVTNSPVTETGTLTGAWATQTTGKAFMSPNGSTGTPSFRAIAAADLGTTMQPQVGALGVNVAVNTGNGRINAWGSTGTGIYGATSSGVGVWGNASSSGYGVQGYSDTGRGVYGVAATTGSGVYGTTDTGLAFEANGNYGTAFKAFQFKASMAQNNNNPTAYIQKNLGLNGFTATGPVLLVENAVATASASYGPLIQAKKGSTVVFQVNEDGTINNPALLGTTSTTIDTATNGYADVSSAGATALTVTNVVAGRVFTIKVTSSGGGAISFVTLTPTWEGSAPATVTATKSTRIVCLGTGANAALCSVAKENF